MILRDAVDEQVVADTLKGYHRPPPGLNPRVIVDLGCHIGTTMLDLKSLYPRAKIVGVEMDQDNALFASMVTGMPVLWTAVSSSNGESVYGGSESWGYRLGLEGKRCPTATLASIYKTLGLERVDYLKVDIEGSEERLFATRNWVRATGYLKAEIHEPYTVSQAVADLRKLGFDTKVNEQHWSCVEAWR